MAPSGSKTFSFPVDDIIRKAMKRVGGEWTNAEEQENARLSLNFIMLGLINKDVPLGSIKEQTVSVGTSDGSFSIENGTIGILDCLCRTSGRDIPMGRMSFLEAHNINDKNLSGRPTSFWTEVSNQELKLKIWRINDTVSRELVYYALVQPDVVTRSSQDLDVMQRYIPAITEKLAYEIGKDRKGISTERLQMIKQDAKELMDEASEADRERASLYIRPRLR